MATFIERMVGAAMLDVATYEEVEHDTTATGQAAAAVALVAAAQAIGQSSNGIGVMIVGVLSALLGWLVWSAITYVVGVSLFGGRADWGEMLRTIGFAQTPGVLAVVGFIPLLGGLARLAAAVWTVVAVIVAIRQALDVGTGKAVGTALVGLFVNLVLLAILGIFFGTLGLIAGGVGALL